MVNCCVDLHPMGKFNTNQHEQNTIYSISKFPFMGTMQHALQILLRRF